MGVRKRLIFEMNCCRKSKTTQKLRAQRMGNVHFFFRRRNKVEQDGWLFNSPSVDSLSTDEAIETQRRRLVLNAPYGPYG